MQLPSIGATATGNTPPPSPSRRTQPTESGEPRTQQVVVPEIAPARDDVHFRALGRSVFLALECLQADFLASGLSHLRRAVARSHGDQVLMRELLVSKLESCPAIRWSWFANYLNGPGAFALIDCLAASSQAALDKFGPLGLRLAREFEDCARTLHSMREVVNGLLDVELPQPPQDELPPDRFRDAVEEAFEIRIHNDRLENIQSAPASGTGPAGTTAVGIGPQPEVQTSSRFEPVQASEPRSSDAAVAAIGPHLCEFLYPSDLARLKRVSKTFADAAAQALEPREKELNSLADSLHDVMWDLTGNWMATGLGKLSDAVEQSGGDTDLLHDMLVKGLVKSPRLPAFAGYLNGPTALGLVEFLARTAEALKSTRPSLAHEIEICLRCLVSMREAANRFVQPAAREEAQEDLSVEKIMNKVESAFGLRFHGDGIVSVVSGPAPEELQTEVERHLRGILREEATAGAGMTPPVLRDLLENELLNASVRVSIDGKSPVAMTDIELDRLTQAHPLLRTQVLVTLRNALALAVAASRSSLSPVTPDGLTPGELVDGDASLAIDLHPTKDGQVRVAVTYKVVNARGFRPYGSDEAIPLMGDRGVDVPLFLGGEEVRIDAPSPNRASFDFGFLLAHDRPASLRSSWIQYAMESPEQG